jgi:hypothetical protein
MAILTGEGRKAPKTYQNRADLLKSMFAYTGMYRVDGDKWLTKVEGQRENLWRDDGLACAGLLLTRTR